MALVVFIISFSNLVESFIPLFNFDMVELLFESVFPLLSKNARSNFEFLFADDFTIRLLCLSMSARPDTK